MKNKKGWLGYPLIRIGTAYQFKGEYKKASDYFTRSLNIFEGLENKGYIARSELGLGISYYYEGTDNNKDYLNNTLKQFKTMELLENSLTTMNTMGAEIDKLIWATTFLFLSYNNLEIEYDENEILSLIKETENISYYFLNYALFQLIEDTYFLESAYNEVQEKADNLEPDVAAIQSLKQL